MSVSAAPGAVLCSHLLVVGFGRLTVAGVDQPGDPKRLLLILLMQADANQKTAALGAKLKGNDYRSVDIGIVAAYLTAAATEEGLSTCILGWLDDEKLRKLCGVEGKVRLVITLGYAKAENIREKKRKDLSELVSYKD